MNQKAAIKEGVGAVEKGIETPAAKSLFAKEMQYQVYRIENVLNLKDSKTLRRFVKENANWYNEPILMKFLDSYEGKKTNEFIEKAKDSTVQERERLLDGIRGIIYKAKKEKYVAEKGAVKAEQEKDKEEERLKTLIEKDLGAQELTDIESSLYESLQFPKDKMDFKQVQQYYLKILTGQKALAVHAASMQEKYNASMKKVKNYYDKYENGWRHYAGVADWGWRKAKGAWGTVSGGFSRYILRRKPAPKPPSEEDKINDLVKKATEHYDNSMGRVKNLKNNLLSRSNELKLGLGTFKGNLRDKLKTLIARGDWTKAKQVEKEILQEQLKKQKEALEESLKKAQTQGDEIDNAKKGTGRLSADLQKKYTAIEGGETNLNQRIQAVLVRVKQLETYYGSNDPRVRNIRENVLLPLTQSRDKIKTAKENTQVQITDTDKKNQKLDILKADTYVAETASIEQISKLNLQITSEGRKIGLLKDQRLELHKLLEGMEFAYAAVDEFKDNVGKNLDKMNDNNNKTVDALGKQMAALKKTQVRPPGMGTSLYNTVGVGKWGLYGAAIELPFKHAPRTVGYLGAKLFGSDVKWKDTEKWTLPGLVEAAVAPYDKWLDKGAFSQYVKKDSHWFWKLTTKQANFSAGAFGMVTGVIRGANALIFETPKVLDSIELMATDWKYTKEAFKGIINYHHLEKGQYSIWAGKTTADVVVLVLTAGSSAAAQAGAKAAAISGRVGRLAKALAYTKGFAGEMGRIVVVAPGRAGSRVLTYFKEAGVIKGTAKLAVTPVVAAYRIGRYGFDVMRGIVTGKGMQFAYRTRLARMVGEGGSAANPVQGSKLHRLWEKTDGIAKSNKFKGTDKFKRTELDSIIKNSDIDNLFRRVQNGELSKLTLEELGILHQGIGSLMYKQGTGLIARTRLEGFRNSLGRYMNGRMKAEALEQTLNFKRAHVALLQQQPTTVRGVHELKGQIEKRLIDINDEIPRLESRIKRIQQGTVGKAALKHWSDKLNNINVEKIALQAKYKQLNYWEILKNKPAQMIASAKTKLQSFTPTLKGKSKLEVVAELGKFATAPLWMPYRYAGRIFKRYYEFYTKPDAAKATAALEKALAQKGAPKLGSSADALTNLKAFSDASAEINTLLKAGQIKEAVKFYQSARIYANSLNPPIPFAALDRSFMGHLHRLAPATANYFSKTLDLTDPDRINGLPEQITINGEEWKKMTNEHASMMVRMKQSVEMGGSFVGPEKEKKPEKSFIQKTGSKAKSAAIGAGRTVQHGAEVAYTASRQTVRKVFDSISLPSWMSVKSAKDAAESIAEKAELTAKTAYKGAGKAAGAVKRQAEAVFSASTKASMEALSNTNKAIDESIEKGNLRKAIEKYHDAKRMGAQLTGKAKTALDWDRSFLEYIHKVIPESKKHIKDIYDLSAAKLSSVPEKLKVDTAAISQAKAKLERDVKQIIK